MHIPKTGKDLTLSEKIIIDRIRSGLNQKEYAELHGVSQRVLTRWENGEVNRMQTVPEGARDLYDCLSSQEKCIVCRKRLGLTQRKLAAKINLSRAAVISAEKGYTQTANLIIEIFEKNKGKNL